MPFASTHWSLKLSWQKRCVKWPGPREWAWGLLQARSAQKKGELHTHAQAPKLHHKGAKH